MDTDILITEKDYQRLKHLLSRYSEEARENLEIEIERAKVVADDEIPPNVVTMNSRLRYLDKSKNEEHAITIVYPDQADYKDAKVSVMAPLGSALIGLKVNQEINWMFPSGQTKTLKVLEILYQPEANGDWDL